MKKTMLLLGCLLLLLNRPFAQTSSTGQSEDPAFMAVMETQLRILDTARSAETFISLANSFERIGNAGGKYWQPFYYAAFCYAVMAVQGKDKNKIDLLADKAQEFLDKATANSPGNSEICTVQAMVLNTKILADPTNRWRDYSVQSAEFLRKAKEQDPSNPRPYFVEGRTKMFTPPAMGGGNDVAIPLFEEAISKFKSFQPANSIAPRWGEGQAQKMLDQLKKG